MEDFARLNCVEGGEARNHEAEIEAVARALAPWVTGRHGARMAARAALDAVTATPLDRAVDRAIAEGEPLPDDILAGMEADIRANPERFPLLNRLLTEADDA